MDQFAEDVRTRMARSSGEADRAKSRPIAGPITPMLAPSIRDDFLAEGGQGVRNISVRKNKDILVSGKHYECVYVNHDGWLSRYKILHNGSRQIIDFVLPGQIFGMQACMFNKSLYSVAAITDSSLSAIPFAMIDAVFDRNPRLAKAMFWSAGYEAAILAEHLIDAARRSAYERISHLLLELFVRLQAAGMTNGMSFEAPLTQEVIGDALGLTTVHVNRTVRALREDKLIAIEGKLVTILDFEALSLISDFENSYLAGAARALESGMCWSKLGGGPSPGRRTECRR